MGRGWIPEQGNLIYLIDFNGEVKPSAMRLAMHNAKTAA